MTRYLGIYLYTLLLGGFGAPAVVFLAMGTTKATILTAVAMMQSNLWALL
jgi:hypothetical protein